MGVRHLTLIAVAAAFAALIAVMVGDFVVDLFETITDHVKGLP